MIKRTKQEIYNQIKNVMSDYLKVSPYMKEPSERTLGYLQLLLNYFDSFSKPVEFMDKPINKFPITEMGKGRTDALEWLHRIGKEPSTVQQSGTQRHATE